MGAKRRQSKAGSTAPLRKAYLYWLVIGVVVLVAMRGKDLWRSLGGAVPHAKSGKAVAARQVADVTPESRNAQQAVSRAVACLSQVSLSASNQLTVVRYLITSTQSSEISADQQLAWLPQVVAIYRDGLQNWRARTTSGRNCREGDVIPDTKVGGLRVEYVDDRLVLLCSATDAGNPHPLFALPVTKIDGNARARYLQVEGQRAFAGDHIYFSGWDFKIELIARDRFEMTVKPLNTSEGQVRMYQFVF